jgi:hypothetical protein
METLKFGHNWNGKLQNTAFTTIRLFNPMKYQPGVVFSIILEKDGKTMARYGEASIAEIRKIRLDQINEFIARLDTGYSAEECKDMLKTMYKNKNIDWKYQELALVLLVKIKPQPMQKSIFN